MPSKVAQRVNNTKLPVSKRIQAGAKYHKVSDGRKRAIRGLWQRGSRFYARIAVEDLNTGRKQVRRVPLEGVHTVAQAQKRSALRIRLYMFAQTLRCLVPVLADVSKSFAFRRH